MAEKREALYRDQNTGAERRSSTRMGYPYVLVSDETEAKPQNGRRKRKQPEAEDAEQ
jgi:hypothetical protein